MTQKSVDGISYKIIGAAIEVHKHLGPGLLEKVYHKCLLHELSLRDLQVSSEKRIALDYKGISLDVDLRYDLLVEECVVVEVKAVNEILPIFEAQVISYAKMLMVPKALIINFNCGNIFREGQWTFVNEYYARLPYS